MRTSFAISALVLLIACSDPSGPNNPPQLTIDGGAQRSILIGTHAQLHARVVGGDENEAVQWSSSDPTIAHVDNAGMLRVATTYTACSWVNPGDCQVRSRFGLTDARQKVKLAALAHSLQPA